MAKKKKAKNFETAEVSEKHTKKKTKKPVI